MPSPRLVVRRSRRTLLATAAGGLAAVVFASSALAETDSVRFEYGENGTWTVPDRVSEIEVEVAGAGGGGHTAPGGNGALVQAAIEVSGGMTFDVGVGGGGEATFAQQSGGGGASIIESGDILIIAGGGGGATNWSDASGGNAGNNASSGAGQNGGLANKRSGGGGGNGGTGGTGAVAAGAGEDYDPSRGLHGTGGQRGRGAVVGGAGGEARDERNGNYGDKASPPLGGGGGAGYGGGSSGFDAYSWMVSDLRGGGGAGGSIAQGTGVQRVEGASSYYSSNGGAGGSARRVSGTDGWVVITWVIPTQPSEPAAGDASVEREPVVLTLTMPAGMNCSAPTSDASGAWIQLPAADECEEGASSSERSSEPAGLLGWATTPDFPTGIAQRQVSNDWGTYELEREDGSLEAVFIPAGGWAQASSDTTLFPIWAS